MSLNADIQADEDEPLDDFGEAQIWTPAGGAAVPFTGIAEVVYGTIETIGGRIISADYTVTGKKSVIGAAKQGDAVTFTAVLSGLSAVSCKVVEPQDDSMEYGPGFTRLILKKA